MNYPRYILFILALLMSVGMRGQYNPTNPAEPGVYYTLTLQATPSGGGSFNKGTVTSYAAGTRVGLQAYTNSNFTFTGWEQDGEILSTEASFTYTMPARNVSLIAHYSYVPDNPSEPSEPNLPVYSQLYLTASPAAGGYFNVSSGSRFQVGSVVALKATANSNFTFRKWTIGDSVVSTSRSYNYVMEEGMPKLTAHFEYTPSNPSEPSEPRLYHQLNVVANPSAGGYFNISSGNQYQEGSEVTLRAYSNQYYTFLNWTLDGQVVSSASSFSFVMPTYDATLVANYSYSYNPGSPNEPGQPGIAPNNIYGMTENGVRGQTVSYPVSLENSTVAKGMAVDMQFPDGFGVQTDKVVLAGRATGQTVNVEALGDNNYRFVLSGENALAGSNGKVFEVPVTVADSAMLGHAYPVVLTHGVLYPENGDQTPISVRSGYIYVERMTEDGLYARYSFEKLLDRVQFNNLSSDKAKRFLWDFGDGTKSSERNPLHRYEAPGYYDVTLTTFGEIGEDVAQMTILVNERMYWTLGGPLVLSRQQTGVRTFEAADTLLRFVNTASLTENLNLMVQTGESHTLALTDAHLRQIHRVDSMLRSAGLLLSVIPYGQGDAPTLELGTSEDVLTDSLLNQWNRWSEYCVCSGVVLKLCGTSYNPSAIRSVHDQTIQSGETTEEMDFSDISADLSFRWSLTTMPDEEYVAGFETEGTGNIPAMQIENVDNVPAVLTYHVEGYKDETFFCAFDKTVTVKAGAACISEKEWNILCSLRDQLVEQGWRTPWDMRCGREEASSLKGLSFERGHVTGIDLSYQQLGGELPTCMFQLPKLARFSCAHNNLQGDVAKQMLQEMTAILSANPSHVSCLESLDLSYNQFTGNIGVLSSLSNVWSKLKELDASHNRLKDVKPQLPATIIDLDLSGQATDVMLEMSLTNPDVAAVLGQLPSLFGYQHQKQTWQTTAQLCVTDYCPAQMVPEKKWSVLLDATGEGIAVECQPGSNVFRGQIGDTLFVSYPCADEEVKNSYCLTTFTFDNGDTNFTGTVDASDLQATILFIFEDYATRPFNFTAANLFADNSVNVQDVVCLVNMLLESDAALQQKARRQTASETDDAAVEICIHNGIVYMYATEPVSALHIQSCGEVVWALEQYGLTRVSSEQGVVAYSMAGRTLPAGWIEIGRCGEDAVLCAGSASSVDARTLGLRISDGGATAINHVEGQAENEAVYTISGVRHAKPGKGLYLQRRNNGYIKIIKK